MRRCRKNITIIHNEIDYDKLAEAIVNAQMKTSHSYSASKEWMRFILLPTLRFSALLCVLFSVSLIRQTIATFAVLAGSFDWNTMFMGVLGIACAFYVLVFAYAFMMMAEEVKKENNRDYIATLFSNTVAIAALIIALIALLKR